MKANLLNTTNLPEDVELYAYNAVVDAECSDPTLAQIEASLEETIEGFPGLSVMRFDGRVVLAYHGQEIAEFRAQFLVTAYSGESGEGDAQDMDGFEYVDTLETAWAKRGEWEAMGKTVTIEEV